MAVGVDAKAGRLFVKGCAVLIALGGLLALSAGSAAAAPAPSWQITAAPYPSNFEPGASGTTFAPGPGFVAVARNIGSLATDQEFTVEVTLPTGLEVVAGAVGRIEPTGAPLSCVESAVAATCSSTEPVPGGGSAVVFVPVFVSASSGVLNAEAEVREGGAINPVSTDTSAVVSVSHAAFDFIPGPSGFYGLTTDEEGNAVTGAGTYPYQMTIGLGLPYELNLEAVPTGGGLRDAEVTLPRGVAVNATVTKELCTEAELERSACPVESQVGIVQPFAVLSSQYATPTVGLYNMVPAPGVPAELGFEVIGGVVIHLRGHLRGRGEYVLAARSNETIAKVTVVGAAVTLWGDPSAAAHDEMRGACGETNARQSGKCPGGKLEIAEGQRSGKWLLAMPSNCPNQPLVTKASIDSWLEPQIKHERSFVSTDNAGTPVTLANCGGQRFEPSIEAKLSTAHSDSPSGLEVKIHQPQNLQFDGPPVSTLKDVQVTLPPGMTVNASSADGLGACSQANMGLEGPAGARPIIFDEEPSACPNNSKVGTVEASTPLLDHRLSGAVYLAEPFKNPFGSLLALYLAIEDPQSGIVVKLAGEVRPDEKTGQLTTVFEQNPELPIEDIVVNVFGGNRAPLQTPPVCGAVSASARLTPWSSPQGADATPNSPPVAVDLTPSGQGNCPTNEASAPNAPAFTAGTLTPQAGAYSPFLLKIARDDGSQRIGSIETTMPPGLTGKLAGIPYCSEAQIAAAKQREHPNLGADELASPSCPLATEVGTVTVGAGAGPTPFYAGGHAYLAGPYKGAPLSLVIIVPAIAGPFDLGTVVVRTALNVDLQTAQIKAVSDPLPTIIDGIPLDVRSIALNMGRPNFVLNPTSCNAMRVLGSSVSTLNQAASLSNRFQVGDCGNLGFKPKVKISLKGATRRTGHPALKAVVTYPKGGAYANIARAQVGLPHSEFLDQGNLNLVCKQADLKAGTCPSKAIYGKVKAWTPLLDKPLEGNVYLGVGFGYKLPALVAELNGQIRVLLVGRVDTTKGKGLRNTFEAVPDAAVERFVLEMKGGKKYGLLENSENICRKPQKASARFVAQNGKVAQLHPKISRSCKRSKPSKSTRASNL